MHLRGWGRSQAQCLMSTIRQGGSGPEPTRENAHEGGRVRLVLPDERSPIRGRTAELYPQSSLLQVFREAPCALRKESQCQEHSLPHAGSKHCGAGRVKGMEVPWKLQMTGCFQPANQTPKPVGVALDTNPKAEYSTTHWLKL